MLIINPIHRIKAAGRTWNVTAQDKRLAVRLLSLEGEVLALHYAPRSGALTVEQVRARAEAGQFGPTSGMHQALTSLADLAEANPANKNV